MQRAMLPRRAMRAVCMTLRRAMRMLVCVSMRNDACVRAMVSAYACDMRARRAVRACAMRARNACACLCVPRMRACVCARACVQCSLPRLIWLAWLRRQVVDAGLTKLDEEVCC